MSIPIQKAREYRAEHGEDRADWFFYFLCELSVFVAKRGWVLEEKDNKNYYAFKRSPGESLFGIALGPYDYLYIKLSESEALSFKAIPFFEYNHRDRQAHYPLIPGKSSIDDFAGPLELAYARSVK